MQIMKVNSAVCVNNSEVRTVGITGRCVSNRAWRRVRHVLGDSEHLYLHLSFLATEKVLQYSSVLLFLLKRDLRGRFAVPLLPSAWVSRWAVTLSPIISKSCKYVVRHADVQVKSR